MAKYKREVTAYLLDRIDIADVVGSAVSLKRAGRNLKGLCPFHSEKTPSFVVSDERQRYHCFGCGASGSAIDFVMQSENMGFLDALEVLADRYVINIEQFIEKSSHRDTINRKQLYAIMTQAARLYYVSLKNSPEAIAYLKNRGLSIDIIKKFGLGFAPDSWDFCLSQLKKQSIAEQDLLACGLIVKNESGRYYDRFRKRIIFPIFDGRGRVIAFGGRVLDNGLPKYLNSPETPIFYKSNTLYGLNFARKNVDKAKSVFLVEGYMDVIALNQFGYPNAVASLGTALTEHHIKLLSRVYDEVIFAYDGDQAGRNAIMKSLGVLKISPLKVRILNMAGAKDPDEFLKENGREVFENQIEKAMNTIEFSIHHIKKDYNLSDDDERLRFLKEAYHFIDGVTQPSERHLYLKRLAQTVHLQVSVILEDYARHSKKIKQSSHSETEQVDSLEQKDDCFDYDPELFETLENKDLHIDTKLFTIEKALLKSILADKKHLDSIEENDVVFYYEKLKILYKNIIDYYKSHNEFDINQAISYFDLDEIKHINEIMAITINVKSIGGVKKIILQHKKLFIEARIKEIDLELQRQKLNPSDAAQLLYREKLVERVAFQEQLKEVTKALRA